MDSVSQRGAPAEPDLAARERQYRQLLIEQLERLTFKGISRSGKAISLPLEDIYVELKAVADVPDAADTYSADERRLLVEAEARGLPDGDLRRELDSLRVERWREESRRGQGRMVRRSMDEAIADPARPGLVILGDPGCGKTTLLHYLALRAAREGLPEHAGVAPRRGPELRAARGQPRLPIFVPLAAYDDWLRRDHEPLSLSDFLPVYYDTWCSRGGLGPVFRQALDEGRALVLLDGLDEVLDITTRRHIANQARALIQGEAARGNRFVVTSRIVGYREAQLPGDLPHVTVLDFGEREIEAFARRWCEACEVWLADGQRTAVALKRAAQEEKQLLAEVRANPSVLRLAANPLLLTMLALLRRQGGRLPDERVRLYERYIEMLLDSNWESARSDGARTREPPRFDRNLATTYLIELALWLQRHKPSGTARRQDLEGALVEIALRADGVDPLKASAKDRQQAHDKAALFLKDMRHFAGLLAERGQDAFGFLHLTFQEYFAGRALARMDPEERWAILKENLHRQRWREPILLCAGQLGIVEGRNRAVSELGRRILGAQSPHEEILHRDVLLAGAMAADGVGFDRALLDELASKLSELADDRVRAVRVEALSAITKLARLSHKESRAWLEERVLHKYRAEEMAEALESVLGAERLRGVRRALMSWIDGSDDEASFNAIGPLRTAASGDEAIRRLLIERLGSVNEGVRWTVVRALGALTRTDEDVRDALLDKLDDPDDLTRGEALEALGALVDQNGEIRSLFIRKLEDPDQLVRREAASALGRLASSDAEVRHLLIKGLDDRDIEVRVAAIKSLEALVSKDEEVRKLLLVKVGDSKQQVRQAAIAALGAAAPSDGRVRDALLRALGEPDGATRQAAVVALGKLVPDDADVRGIALGMLDDVYPEARIAALGALKPLSDNPTVRRSIMHKLGHMEWPVLPEMINALRPLATVDSEVRRLIIDKIEHPDENARKASVRALAGLVSADAKVRALVLRRLDDRNVVVREAAVSALGTLAAIDAEVCRLVLDKLEDPAKTVCWTAMLVLGSLASSDMDSRRLALSKLDDLDRVTRTTAVRSLRKLAARDTDVRQSLLKKLDDVDQMVRATAIEALTPTASSDADVRRGILCKLNDPDDRVRGAAVRGLGTLVTSDVDARRLVLGKIEDPGSHVRQEVLRAIMELIPGDALVRRLALDKLDDPDYRIRHAALRALGTLAQSDVAVRRSLSDRLDDVSDSVRLIAIEMLGPSAPHDAALYKRITDELDGESFHVRSAAVQALAPLIADDSSLRQRLLPWLGAFYQLDNASVDWNRRRLAGAYAPLLATEAELLAQVVTMLRSVAWPERKGAAWTLIAMPGGPPPDVLPALRGLIDDTRAEESWPARLEAAAILLNDCDSNASQAAIAATVQAFDYATQPWYDQVSTGRIRARAAKVLGALDPIYRNDAIVARLIRLIGEDCHDEVRDAAYHAILRLAVSPEAEHDIDTLLKPPPAPAEQPSKPTPPSIVMQPLPPSLILHLSDLHFGTRESAAAWYSQLAEDLQGELSCSRLDAVILSGDIANQSTPEEYDAARLFLEKLCGEFQLSPQQVIPVPGNHDLHWGLAKKAYKLFDRDDYTGKLEDGHFIDIGSGAVRVRDDDLYPRRFEHFARFYEDLRGEPYPLSPEQQALLYRFPAQRLIVLGLNSAWNLDHHFRSRAAIHPQALSRALDQIRSDPATRDWLKIAAWHHPVNSAFEDRIKDHGFLERLAGADFRLGLHGHIHKAQNGLYRYDVSAAGRRIELVCAGTFGAPTHEWVPGYPLQYQLLRFEGGTLTVETRRREEINGTWKPDARWTAARGKDPLPRYQLAL